MKFYYSIIWQRITDIVKSPVLAWKKIKSESGYAIETITLLMLCCLLVGLATLNHNMHWISETFILFSAIIVISVLARFISSKVRKTNWEGTLNLTVYSAFPFIICYAASLLFGGRLYLLPLGLIYSLIILYIGISILTDSKKFETIKILLGFVAVASICFYISLILLSI